MTKMRELEVVQVCLRCLINTKDETKTIYNT